MGDTRVLRLQRVAQFRVPPVILHGVSCSHRLAAAWLTFILASVRAASGGRARAENGGDQAVHAGVLHPAHPYRLDALSEDFICAQEFLLSVLCSC